ncbi:TY-Chap domain-containing protein [Nocardia sp. NPDC050175]|uniref:TY-Chap domain-containing protein n=1 Tax=Nocardia sp. NPDC050175 TaxID=3364317 RepID=UPI0037907F7E
MTGWAEFADGLAEQLARLPSGAVVVIGEAPTSSDKSRIAQFRQFDDSVWAQLSGDRWLDPTVQAGEAGRHLIREAGWREPDDDHIENWWVELPWPVASAAYRRVAEMVVTGLRDAFRIAGPTALVYQAWNEKSANSAIELPLLGLPVEA